MVTRYCERRRHLRIPATGLVRWQSGRHAGHGELVDISPAGAGLRMAAHKATQLGPRITLEMELSPGRTWCLGRNARVVRRIPDADGSCRVGVEFSPPR